jgi:hypothetical protein
VDDSIVSVEFTFLIISRDLGTKAVKWSSTSELKAGDKLPHCGGRRRRMRNWEYEGP